MEYIQCYDKNNANFAMNGDVSLRLLSGSFQPTLNGSWVLQIEIDKDDKGGWKHLEHKSVVKVKLPRWGDQLFRVTNPEVTDLRSVQAQCYPIGMYDAQKELVCRDCRPTNLMGQEALEWILRGCGASEKYKVDCNINKVSTAFYIRKNFIQCLASDDDNSFLNRWGGEIIYDNYTFRVYEQAGVDQNFEILASKNVSGFKVSEDDSGYLDVIIPVGYNGWTSSQEISREHVDMPPYRSFVDYGFIKFKDDATDDDRSDPSIVVCETKEEMEAKLAEAAKKSFADGEYQPRFTYDIDFIDLKGARGYEGMDAMLDLWLGDHVKVKNLDRHISTDQKVVALSYDLITETITSLTLGMVARDFFNTTSEITSSIQSIMTSKDGEKTVIAEKIQGVINAANASLRAQKNVAQKQEIVAMLFEDLDPNSPTFGAMALGTQGLQISKKRNPSNTGWVWGTAITYQSVIADYIITGTLTGKDGNFWLNLDDGSYVLGDRGLFKGTINTTKDANIGRALFLDTNNDGNPNHVTSGVYLGGENMGLQNPRLQLWSVGGWKFAFIGTDDINKDPHVRADKDGPGGSSAEIYCSDDVCLRMNNFNTIFNAKRIDVKDTGKNKSGTALTYEGTVSGITTVNGFVTGVTP